MENTCGYVYVMINPSYGEDVVKIGKTTKEPEERAKELSAATGVATPFIVVYKRLFRNCHYAEKLVHHILEEKGCRVNTNREFFFISISDAINIILEIPDEQGYDICEPFEGEDSNADLAEEYYRIAIKYTSGSDDVFQDFDKAISCFERSAELGNVNALHKLGETWFLFKRRADKALPYLHAAANKGCWESYGYMAQIYESDKNCKNEVNADLAWRKYFESIKANEDTLNDLNWDTSIGTKVVDYLFSSNMHNKSIPSIVEEVVFSNRERVKRAFKDTIDWLTNNNNEDLLRYYERYVGKYLDSIEEKVLLSDSAGNDLGKNYYILAEKYFSGEDGYEKSDVRALMYFRKSSELGYKQALINIGYCWLLRNQPEKASDAWKEFYNTVFDKVSHVSTTVSDEEKSQIVDGFYKMFHIIGKNKAYHLLYDDYFYMAAHCGLTEYLNDKSAEAEELTNAISNFQSKDSETLSNMPIDELLDYGDMSLKRIQSIVLSEELNAVLSVMKRFVGNINPNHTMQRLE